MKCVIEGDQLTIHLEGLEKIWALKSRLQVPKYAITAVDYVAQRPLMRDLRGYWRLPAPPPLPGTFLAGSYKHNGEREFWYLHMKTPGILTLLMKPKAFNYDKIRITCTPEIAQDIADWWHEA